MGAPLALVTLTKTLTRRTLTWKVGGGAWGVGGRRNARSAANARARVLWREKLLVPLEILVGRCATESPSHPIAPTAGAPGTPASGGPFDSAPGGCIAPLESSVAALRSG